jgi:hypothetical protein
MELTVSVLLAAAAGGAVDPAPFAEAEADFNHPEPTRTLNTTRNPAANHATVAL